MSTNQGNRDRLPRFFFLSLADIWQVGS